MPTEQTFANERFPRASKYHPDWIRSCVSGGANSLWLAEWLAEALPLKPGMRVLDLGCGRAASSIFLHREFGVEVWAADLWFSATENFQRIRDAGVADGVYPLHVDARALPFANEFFDAIVSIDSLIYFGGDDHYQNYLARFLKPGGAAGFAGVGLVKEFEEPFPAHLAAWWSPEMWCIHSAAWWRRLWERTGIMDVESADTLSDGWRYWLDWHRTTAPDNAPEIAALEADRGQWLTYVRLVGRRRADAAFAEPITAIPTEYVRAPLLRDDQV